MNKPPLMTQTAFAKHRGVGRSAVSNYKKADLLVFAEGDDGSRMVDVERSEARLNRKIDPARGRPTGGRAAATSEGGLPFDGPSPSREPQGAGVAEVRTELMRAQIVGKTLENAKRGGELVPLLEYERRSSELGRMTRDRMHSFLRSYAERFAAERDPRQIVAVGSAEIDRQFDELADQVESGVLVEMDEAEVLAAVEAEVEAETEGADLADAS